VTRLCRCDSCTIGRYRPEDDTVVIVAEFDAGGRAKGAPGVYAMSEFPATREVLESQEPLVVNADDPRADPAERADLRRWGDRSNLMIPLVFRGRSIGLLEAVDWERERSYSRQELRLVRALAGHAAVALRNAELYQAADSADAAFREFHERMGAASARLRETSGSTGPVDPLAAIATAIRDAFAAHLVVMALDGTVVAAVTDPAADEAAAGRADAHVLTSGADTPRGRLAVTAATSAGATDGDDDLLELATSFAALALRCDEAGVAH
jgi:transcriptional regulator with GAF, ATPase, and Fis domain